MNGEQPPELDVYRHWTPAAQEQAARRLAELNDSTWRPWYCPNVNCDGKPHDTWAWQHCRSDQRPPQGEWLVWVLRGGRGSGKTRGGAEWTRKMTEKVSRIALIAPTGADVRDVIVEGESGILAISPPGKRPNWEPSKRRLTWPNGCIGTTYSGEEPDRLRGPQQGAAWCDEGAHMPLIEEVWTNLMLGLRLGKHPRAVLTTTPTPVKWLRDLLKSPLTVDSRVSTYANLDNLAPTFAQAVLARYEGTKLGSQELHGEILDEAEGALWSWEMIETHRTDTAPNPDRIVVAIDPAGTARKKSDETGIVVAAVADGDFYVLRDASGRMTPSTWASRAVGLYEEYQADAIVVESNYGGDMTVHTLRSIDATPRIKQVNSRRGKAIRAEPVVALYERGKVKHLPGLLDLETQMVTWVPGQGESPDRVDALVHAVTDLARHSSPVLVANPNAIRHLRAV